MAYDAEIDPSHEMQHEDSPTWCIHCGTFDIYCGYICTAKERSSRYDSRIQENFVRIAEGMGLL